MTERLQDETWQEYWTEFAAGATPASTELHPELFWHLEPTDRVIDIGCAYGRITQQVIEEAGCRVTGVDINAAELVLAACIVDSQKADFVQASATELPFRDNQFDAGLLLGVLGGVSLSIRKRLLNESVRVVEPSGIIYISEMERFPDSNGHWAQRYAKSAAKTGEYGSVVVTDYTKFDRPVQFVGYHFLEDELSAMLADSGVHDITVKRTAVDTRDETGHGDVYSNLSMWGYVG
jgi:ubiquinone/menaquinone biosynthesis C-methylase UbiE